MSATATSNALLPRTRVLVASADSGFRKQLMMDPQYASAWREEASGGAHALARLGEMRCDSVLLDRHLPDLDAGEVAELIRQRYPLINVEIVDSHKAYAKVQDVEIHERSEEDGGDASRESGEVPTIEKPPLSASTARGLGESSFLRAHKRPAFREEGAFGGMVGESRAMQQIYLLARMVAGRDTTVLILGETGTGKEMVAQGIHALSGRAKHPCLVVNCAAIPEALLESELFGHARGAFTGAVQSRLGRIHMAQGGTLFLDEIGDLPLSMQAKLLRFLQNGEVQRLGSSEVYRVDVRVLCATNVSLLEMVKAKRFRQDLYYRLAVFPIVMPPLRARAEDVPALARFFLTALCADLEFAERTVEDAALEALQNEPWPGNVRELQHAVERAFILAGNETVLRREHFRSFTEMSSEMEQYETK
ncbi:MAG: sigma-54 dependent transcriptional regulator [Candidatus Acidiferrum sp.]|jgi:DNA-binding NtrC family response regulator